MFFSSRVRHLLVSIIGILLISQPLTVAAQIEVKQLKLAPVVAQPKITDFTISGTTGTIATAIILSSAGEGRLTECYVSYGRNTYPLAITVNRDGSNTCTGTIALGRTLASSSNFVAYATNSSGGKASSTPPRVVTSTRVEPTPVRTVQPTEQTQETRPTTATPTQAPRDTAPSTSQRPEPNTEPTDTNSDSIIENRSEATSTSEETTAQATTTGRLEAAVFVNPTIERIDGGASIKTASSVPQPEVKRSVTGSRAAVAGATMMGVGLATGGFIVFGVGGPVVWAAAGALFLGGLGITAFGISEIDPAALGNNRAFIEPRDVEKRGSGNALLSLAQERWDNKSEKETTDTYDPKTGAGNAYATGIIGIDVHNGITPGIDLNTPQTPNGLLTLAVLAGKDPSGDDYYETEALVTTKPKRTLQATYEGEAIKKVWWRISDEPFWDTCPSKNDYIHSGALKKIIKNGKEQFTIDLTNVFTPAMKNGSYNGSVTYYAQAIAEGTGACSALRSNIVTFTVKPTSSYLSLINPDAIQPILVTTGNKEKTNGEFTGEQDTLAVDWQAPTTEQLIRFNFSNDDIPRVGRWQIAVVPFNKTQCIAPTALVAQQNVDLTNTDPSTAAFTIPFDTIALNKPKKAGGLTSGISSSVGAGIDVATEIGAKIAGSFNGTQSTPEEKALDDIYKKYIKGRDQVTYYVRYIGIDPSTGDCALTHQPSTAVTVLYGKPSSTQVKVPSYTAHEVPQTAGAVFNITSIEYKPVRFQEEPFNPRGHYIYVRDHEIPTGQYTTTGEMKMETIAKKGEKLYIPQPPSSTPPEDFWDKVTVDAVIEGVSDFVSAIIDVINFAATTYNSLKSDLANAIADGVAALGVPCDTECKLAIEGGLSVGQMALGIPPSVPNFDQLMNEGIDYLAKEAAMQVAEATGVPGLDDAAEYAVKESIKKTIEEVKAQTEKHASENPILIAPDPDYLYKPGQLIITVRNNGTLRDGGRLELSFRDTSSIVTTDLQSRNFFVPVTINIPPLDPGESLIIPVSLEENYQDYAYAKGDVDPSYTCSGDCSLILQTPGYALAMRTGRWMQVYNDAQITLNANASNVARLPVDFNPSSIGIDTNGWKKISKSTWVDVTGDYHEFIPVLPVDQTKTTIKNITLSPKSNVAQ